MKNRSFLPSGESTASFQITVEWKVGWWILCCVVKQYGCIYAMQCLKTKMLNIYNVSQFASTSVVGLKGTELLAQTGCMCVFVNEGLHKPGCFEEKCCKLSPKNLPQVVDLIGYDYGRKSEATLGWGGWVEGRGGGENKTGNWIFNHIASETLPLAMLFFFFF